MKISFLFPFYHHITDLFTLSSQTSNYPQTCNVNFSLTNPLQLILLMAIQNPQPTVGLPNTSLGADDTTVY